MQNFNQIYVIPITHDTVNVNQLSARLTGRNVPLSHGNLKSLEEVTTRARLLEMDVHERRQELNRIVTDHGSAQQHFLTDAVDQPWERAVTDNKLPCYINHTTESVHMLSPKYTEIMASLTKFNYIYYSAYRTAFKLRSLQRQLCLDKVSFDMLTNAFEHHKLGPNHSSGSLEKSKTNGTAVAPTQPAQPPSLSSISSPSTTASDNQASSSASTGTNSKQSQSKQANSSSATTATCRSQSNGTATTVSATNGPSTTTTAAQGSNGQQTATENIPYELRFIGISDIISCLNMIFESANDAIRREDAEKVAQATGKSKKSSKNQQNLGDSLESKLINVPLCVDLCLNLVLALYDA